MLRQLFTAVFLLPALLFSTEFMPWLDREIEIHSRLDCWLQSFNTLDVSHGPNCYRSRDIFLKGSLLLPYKQWSLELEATGANTRHHRYHADNLKFTARYRWLNDIVGDSISLITGISVSQVFKPARHDIGVFHHGGVEGEVHAAIGREVSCYQFWTSRWWTVCGVGMGDIGSPWIRWDGVWERNWCDISQFRVFARTLWGLGKHSLSLNHFSGYGPIHHQSIDLGFRYSYLIKWDLTLSLEYAYRVYAQNCPKNVNFFLVHIYYPFAITDILK